MPGTLVVGPAWIGDMVMAHTLVQRLHQALPDESIEMVAPPATAPIAQRMAEVTKVHELAAGHGELGVGKRFRLGRALAEQKFSRSFVLPNSWKSALVPFFARIPRRSGWLGEARYLLLNDTASLPADRLPLMIERFMGLVDIGSMPAKPYPQPRLTVNPAQQAKLLASHQLLVAEGVDAARAIALCPGAEFGEAKRWPEGHFVEVAKKSVSEGCEVWLMGGPADRDLCQRIASQVHENAGLVKNLAGQTSLPDVVDLLAAAGACVCNDSGLMHVACAVDTPVVALYGSTSPGFTPPLHPDARALTLVDIDDGSAKLDCQPCFQRTCRYEHRNCLVEIEPDYVLDQLATLGVFTGASRL